MKKIFRLFAILLFTLILGIGALFIALQTSYSTSIVNTAFQQLNIPAKAKEVTVTLPYHFTLLDLVIFPDTDDALPIGQIDIWLNEQLINEHKLQIDSVLISGLRLQQGAKPIQTILDSITHASLMSWTRLHQVALSQVDYSDGEFIGRDINIQIEQPQWDNDSQVIPFGSIQLSANQLYWQEQAIDNVLLDLDYQSKDSTIYGASFDWKDAHISGQAEQYEQGWSLINVTIDKLTLTEKELSNLSPEIATLPQLKIQHINSLDLLNSNVFWQGYRLENLNVSLENIDLSKEVWQQKQGYLSLAADNFSGLQHRIVSPTFSLELNPNQVSINDFNGQLYQGSLYFSGIATPDNLTLAQFSLTGMKATLDQKLQSLFLTHHLWNNITVNQLSIENSQLIQLANKPYWQISGANVEGKALQLKRDKKWGFWQGALKGTANSLSYDNIIGTQGIVEMHSNDGEWQLQHAYIPLESGYIEAFADMQFGLLSQPWHVELSADGMPINIINYWLDTPFDISGQAELEISLSGLSGDKLMFDHSLNGSIWAELRETQLTFNDLPADHNAQETIPYLISVDPIDWTVTRGIGTHEPITLFSDEDDRPLSGSIEANIDLLDTEKRKVTLEVLLQEEEIKRNTSF